MSELLMVKNELHGHAVEIRRIALRAIYNARSGHPGGSLSIAEILSVLYFDALNVNPECPDWSDRDRCILSKGHACPAYYAALALRGFFSVEEALTLRKVNSRMEGHPDFRIPGVDAPSGSLGMGLSQGLGMALGGRFLDKDFKTFVILGDGDMQEGNTWEAIMAAGFQRMGTLIAIYDSNKLQGDAPVRVQLDMRDVGDKVGTFGWKVLRVDGHDIQALQSSFSEARNSEKPTFIVADTVKGKGVSFMEGVLRWHGSVSMTEAEIAASLAELKAVDRA